MSDLFLGIEIGGTKLQLGVGTADGSRGLIAIERREVDRAAGAAGILDQIREVATRLASEYPLTAVGIGFGGPVDAAAGRVTTSHQITGWDGYPLTDWCQQLLGLPTVLGNDCDCAALAEARFGAGRTGDTVFYVTVGTGIGGGLVTNGKLLGRHRPAVAEIGHLRPGTAADTPSQTVESVAAGPAIALAIRQQLENASAPGPARQDLLRRCKQQPAQLTAKMVAEAAANGNPIALTALDRALTTLGWAIAQAITLTAADTVVVGGGVSLIGEYFFATLRDRVARYVFPPLLGAYAIVPAGLGETVVVHGALALAAEVK